MFNLFKKKALKKAVDSIGLPALEPDFNFEFQTVGIVLEKNEVSAIDMLLNNLQKLGVELSKLQILVYDAESLVKEVQLANSYTLSDFDQSGQATKKEVVDFINKPFDLLISYYTSDVMPLVWVTANSRAKFKAGISSVTKKVNHFALDVLVMDAEKYIQNLIRYINILKK